MQLYYIIWHCIWFIVFCLIASHCITLHCIASHRIVLHCIALHCFALLHCIELHCIALHCIALHCIALHCITHCIALQSKSHKGIVTRHLFFPFVNLCVLPCSYYDSWSHCLTCGGSAGVCNKRHAHAVDGCSTATFTYYRNRSTNVNATTSLLIMLIYYFCVGVQRYTDMNTISNIKT